MSDIDLSLGSSDDFYFVEDEPAVVVPSIHKDVHPYSPVFSIEELDILYFMNTMPRYYVFNRENSKQIFFLNFFMLPLGYVPGTAETESPFANSSTPYTIYNELYPWVHQTYYENYIKALFGFVSLDREVYTLPGDRKRINPYAEIVRVHRNSMLAANDEGFEKHFEPEEAKYDEPKNIFTLSLKETPETEEREIEQAPTLPSASPPPLKKSFKDIVVARYAVN